MSTNITVSVCNVNYQSINTKSFTSIQFETQKNITTQNDILFIDSLHNMIIFCCFRGFLSRALGSFVGSALRGDKKLACFWKTNTQILLNTPANL